MCQSLWVIIRVELRVDSRLREPNELSLGEFLEGGDESQRAMCHAGMKKLAGASFVPLCVGLLRSRRLGTGQRLARAAGEAQCARCQVLVPGGSNC